MRIKIFRSEQVKNIVGFCLIVVLISLFTTTSFAQKAKPPKSIQKIDFRNRTYQIPDQTIRLKNGKYQSKGAIYSLESQKFQDFDGDNSSEAIITLQKRTKGIVGRYKIYLVYTYKNNNLKLVFGQIRPRGDSVRIEKGNLVLSGFYWDKTDDDCCPSRKETETFKWDKKKKRFVLAHKKSKKV